MPAPASPTEPAKPDIQTDDEFIKKLTGLSELFVSEGIENAGSEDLYRSIVLEDGSGIVFSKGNTTSAIYGSLDANAYITDVFGTLIRKDDGQIAFLSADNMHNDPLSSDETQNAIAPIGNVIVTTEPQVSASDTAPEKTQTTVETPADPAQTVYITDSGEKFHRAGCSFLSDSANEISRAEAEEKGYTACSRCKP